MKKHGRWGDIDQDVQIGWSNEETLCGLALEGLLGKLKNENF